MSPEDSASAREPDLDPQMVLIRPDQPGQSFPGNSPPLEQNICSRSRATSDVMMSSPNRDLAGRHHQGPHLIDYVLPHGHLPVTGMKRPRPNTSSLALALNLDPGINCFKNFWQVNQEWRLALSPDGGST